MSTGLLTPEIREKLLRNGRLTAQCQSEGIDEPDFLPVVKLHTPLSDCLWLLTELDPHEPDIGFGLCDLGMGYPELGSVSIAELESVRAFAIAIDVDFNPTKTLSAYADEARETGAIQA
jgi:hypothetical protein